LKNKAEKGLIVLGKLYYGPSLAPSFILTNTAMPIYVSVAVSVITREAIWPTKPTIVTV
jgi:hypothetical protein